MVDEHPYKVPEVDESKWFSGGHLGGQIQKVNWQASRVHEQQAVQHREQQDSKMLLPAATSLATPTQSNALAGAGGKLHHSCQLLPPAEAADSQAVQEAFGPHGAQEPAARGKVSSVGV